MVLETPTLRADAQRNLERILEAARAVFAEVGLEASVADVAERAGVGTATIFRRFPTKDDLVAAVIEQELHSTLERVRVTAREDPAAALAEFMATAVAAYIGDRCLCEASGGELFQRPRIVALADELTAELNELVRRAQRAGAIRRDVVAEDIGFLIGAVGRAGLWLERTAPGAWRRYLEIILDGLRPEGATRLRHKPPTTQQLHDAKRA
jgi:AcrR family transcriptional regulator